VTVYIGCRIVNVGMVAIVEIVNQPIASFKSAYHVKVVTGKFQEKLWHVSRCFGLRGRYNVGN
jgi:hypothetical protein